MSAPRNRPGTHTSPALQHQCTPRGASCALPAACHVKPSMLILACLHVQGESHSRRNSGAQQVLRERALPQLCCGVVRGCGAGREGHPAGALQPQGQQGPQSPGDPTTGTARPCIVLAMQEARMAAWDKLQASAEGHGACIYSLHTVSSDLCPSLWPGQSLTPGAGIKHWPLGQAPRLVA